MVNQKRYPIRILHVLHGLNRGGIETILMNIYRKIDHDLIQFDFAIVEENKCDYEDEILSLGGRIYRLPGLGVGRFIGYTNAFLRLAKNYKIIHAHWNTVSTIPLLLARWRGVPTRIAHAHIAKTSEGYKGIIKKMLRFFLKCGANHFFACGIDAAKYLYGEQIVRERRCYILNNAIDVSRFVYNSEIRKSRRNELNITENTSILGHVGRFSIQKNQLFLLEIFKCYHENNRDSKLILVGEGELRTEIEDKIRMLHLEKDVILTGNVSDVYEWLQVFDFYVFPSLYEGLSLSVIEAQAAGLKCLCSDHIDRNSKVTDLLDFFPLEASASDWAKRLCCEKNYQRVNAEDLLTSAGYNIQEVSSRLQHFYEDCSEV